MSSTLTARDYEILQHLLRYKIATREMLHRALFAKVSSNAVTKVVTRLLANGWLNRHPFLSASCYFTLSAQSARLLGMPEAAIDRPVSARQMIVEFGIGAYCCLADKPRKRLSAEELQQDYPHLLFDQLASDRYYLDAGFRPELLGQICVDDNSLPRIFLESCCLDIAARAKRAAVRKLMQAGGYRLTVLTAVAEKAKAFRAGLKKLELPEGIRTEVVVIPSLINAVADLDAAAAKLSSRPISASVAQNGSNGHSRSRHVAGVGTRFGV